MNSHEVFIHIHQGCFAGTGAIVRLPQCQWSKPDGYGKISQCITTTKHSKAKTVCIFLGIYCRIWNSCLSTTILAIRSILYSSVIYHECAILWSDLDLFGVWKYFGIDMLFAVQFYISNSKNYLTSENENIRSASCIQQNLLHLHILRLMCIIVLFSNSISMCIYKYINMINIGIYDINYISSYFYCPVLNPSAPNRRIRIA